MTSKAKITLSAEDRTAAAFASVGRSVDKLGFNLGTLKGLATSSLGALALPVSAAGIVNLINSARQAIDEFNDLSDATGSSIENISALDKIARNVGTDFDVVSSALVKFNMVLKDADPDKGAGAVLKALNLDIEELKRLDPAEAMRQVAVALNGYSNSGDKARAIQELFGKSIKDAAPLLQDLADAGKLNAAVTKEQADEVDRFNKELFKLSASAEDVSRALTINLVTALNTIIQRSREAKEAGGDLGAYWGGVRGFYEAVGMTGGKPPGSRSVSGSITDLTSESSAESARLLRGAPPKPPLRLPVDVASGAGRGGRRGAGAAKDPYAEANRYLESLQRQVEAAEKLSATEKALRDLQLGRLGQVTPAQREAILAAAESVDASKELEKAERDRIEVIKQLRQVSIDETEAVIARNEAYQEGIQGMIDATPTAQLEDQRKTMADLATEYERGRFGLVGSQEAVAAYGETVNTFLGNLPDQVEKSNSAMQELGATFASAFEEAIVSGASLKDVLKGLEQDIIRIITRKLVTEPLANWATSAIGAWAGTAFADGGVMTSAGPMPLKKYARGGVANSPQVALYGEGSMPEAYVPLPDGRRIPVAMNGGQSGGTVNHMSFNFTVPATVDRRTQEQMAAMAGAAVQRASRRLS